VQTGKYWISGKRITIQLLAGRFSALEQLASLLHQAYMRSSHHRGDEQPCGCRSDGLFAVLADPAQRLPGFVTGVSAIGEDMPQPREALDDLGEHE
jgi:hypothetical protein